MADFESSDLPIKVKVRWWNDTEKLQSITTTISAILAVVVSFALSVWQDWTLQDNPNPSVFSRLVIVILLALLILGIGYAFSYFWRRNLEKRGSAYLVPAQATDWKADDLEQVKKEVSAYFPEVYQVPTLGQLGRPWHWPREGHGAEWGRHIDELATATMAVQFNDSHKTPDNLVVWADWPVAVGLGGRLTGRQRRMRFRVSQRPSAEGRGGSAPRECLALPSHDFVVAGTVDRVGCAGSLRQLTLTPVRADRTGAFVDRDERPSAEPVVVLLARVTTDEPWLGVPADATRDPAHLDVADPAEVLGGTVTAEFLEYYLLPEGRRPCLDLSDDNSSNKGSTNSTGSASVHKNHDWRHYPALAQEVAEWFRGEMLKREGSLFLVGLMAPQEVSVGLGMILGRKNFEDWPDYVWPLMEPASGQSLANAFIPGVNLGSKFLRHGEFA